MKHFAEYYKDLLDWEDVKFQELISDWREDLIEEIKKDFQSAVANSKLKGLAFIPNKTNQSVGNQVEIVALEKLNEHLITFQIENCAGAGYPDRVLTKGDVKQIALEMKATGDWNPKDSNRRVLTSSSKKLREKFILPIYHLLCTIVYKSEDGKAEIDSLRLDFIEPLTEVSVRLEASVSHKILTNATHKSIVF